MPDARNGSSPITRFYRVIEHFNTDDQGNSNSNSSSDASSYNRPQLFRLIYEYALSQAFRDDLLGPLDDELRWILFSFADRLLDDFFLPLKAAARKTTPPTPTSKPTIMEQDFSDRVSELGRDCLARDRTVSSFKRDGDDAPDDDRILFRQTQNSNTVVDIVHILTHSLMKVNACSRLVEAALAILNIVDGGVVGLIDGADIDLPRNAFTFTTHLYDLFRRHHQHTYRIESLLHPAMSRGLGLPATYTFSFTGNQVIDHPSPRLLAVNRAIGHIIHLSTASSYVDRFLEDMDMRGIRADGSTEFGRMLKLLSGPGILPIVR
ncbi:hypothetical protein GGR53DRAFT_530257 [Hypoxylon sp. FL1150]|nr:hypothetical protein GGR53DRAFT_530257 [Hypoxylon sp. FL1150]